MIRPQEIRLEDLGDTPHEWLELQGEVMRWTPLQWHVYGEQIEHEERFCGKDQ